MNVTIKINCDNSAFVDQESSEVARILRNLAGVIEPFHLIPCDRHPLYDINGNNVGSFDITE